MEEFRRKLASIRKVSEIWPIDGADNIELAIIDGWQCIVKKGELKADQLCVYFEIDSFLPMRPEFEFLRKSSYKKMGDREGFRLKTIRLRGELSQGLALGLGILPDHYAAVESLDADFFVRNERCSDVTELLGVIKYEPPIPACISGKVKGNFPSFIRKTDQERVQNIWNKIKGCEEFFEVTVKLDGASCTYYLNYGVFGVCSRNLDLKEDENNTLWKIAKRHNVEEILKSYGKNIALQGEVIGEGIQGNPEGITGQEFYLFDIWDIDSQEYLDPTARAVLWSVHLKDKGICWCPYADEFKTLSAKISNFSDIKEILDAANGKSLKSDTREGIVFKSMESNLTFKVISNQYLLKQG